MRAIYCSILYVTLFHSHYLDIYLVDHLAVLLKLQLDLLILHGAAMATPTLQDRYSGIVEPGWLLFYAIRGEY